jgi:hypothetical protein
MTKRTWLWILVLALLTSTTGCLFRNHGKCDKDDSSRYKDDCR